MLREGDVEHDITPRAPGIGSTYEGLSRRPTRDRRRSGRSGGVCRSAIDITTRTLCRPG